MLVSVNPGLIIWTIVTFLILVVILGKFGWGPIIGALQRREKSISDALDAAEAARTEAHELREQYGGLIAKAESESREIIQVGRETSERLKREAAVASEAETKRMLERARREIQSARDAALRDIRDTVADLAVEAASKIVQKNLDSERNRSLVDEMIDRLPETERN